MQQRDALLVREDVFQLLRLSGRLARDPLISGVIIPTLRRTPKSSQYQDPVNRGSPGATGELLGDG